MTNIHDLKLTIIYQILKTNDLQLLTKVHQSLTDSINEKKANKIPTTAIRSNISLAQIMQEQNIQPITYEEIRKLSAKMEWEHSLEELLATLN